MTFKDKLKMQNDEMNIKIEDIKIPWQINITPTPPWKAKAIKLTPEVTLT